MEEFVGALAKTIVTGGMTASDWMRTATAHARENMQDLYAEARAESETSQPVEAERQASA